MKRKVVRRKRRVQRKRKFVRRRRSNGRREQVVNASFNSHTTLSIPGGANTARGISFTIDNFAGTDKYKSLYDLFRIVKIKYKQRPRSSVIPLVGAAVTASTGGFIVHALDWDDNVAWSDVAAGRNAWSSKTTSYLNGFQRYWSPRCINALKLATGSTTYVDSPRVSPWISTTAGATAHYGLKWIWGMGGATTNNYIADEFVTIYCQFKHRSGLS